VVVAKGASPAEVLERLAGKKEVENHFDALDVHWSATDEDIAKAYRKLRDEYRPGGDADRLAPDAVARLRARADAAYASLRDPAERMMYRRAMYPKLDFEALDDLLQKRIGSLEMRQSSSELTQSRDVQKELQRTSFLPSRPPSRAGGPPSSGGRPASGDSDRPPGKR
jgi:DnaJ-class molecular chaperone